MNSLRAILLQALMATCLAGTPAVCRAANNPSAALLPGVAATNAPASNAPRPARRLEEDELRGLLTAALNHQRGEDGTAWEFRLTRPWTPVAVPEEPLTVEILEPSPNHITSSCILRFELRAGQKSLRSWQAPVQARLWREVLVAHGSLRRGQLLREADFARERRDVLTLRNPLAELPAEGAAFELAETVPAGAALTSHAIRLKPVLARGQMADAVVRDGTMIISLKVEVLEEGTPGQVVRVRNPQSHRELRGKVLDEQTVAIPL
jgi:flagella basal body P-ring formation protein FlgA